MNKHIYQKNIFLYFNKFNIYLSSTGEKESKKNCERVIPMPADFFA